MDLYSPVSSDTLEEYREQAIAVLDDIESDTESKLEAEETLSALLSIAQEIGLVSYSADSSDPYAALQDENFEHSDYSYWYDAEDLQAALRESNEYDVAEHMREYVDWNQYTEDHISACTEFTHDGTTYYAS